MKHEAQQNPEQFTTFVEAIGTFVGASFEDDRISILS
jgi:hypothetical protein